MKHDFSNKIPILALYDLIMIFKEILMRNWNERLQARYFELKEIYIFMHNTIKYKYMSMTAMIRCYKT